MGTTTRILSTASLFALWAGASAAQGNDSPFNNGSDVVLFFSDPSVGATSGAALADCSGDLYWRTHRGSNFVNDVDNCVLGGSLMEIDGYFEYLYDTDWSTTPHFYVRAHTFVFTGSVPNLSSYCAGTDGVTVVLGPSGLGAPCTIDPSLCSPATTGSVCAPPGFVVGWLVDITFGATPGSGVVITAAGTPADDIATTWFVTGGMSASGGTCGAGDYDLQDAHSTDETQADIAGGINPSGGFQIGGGGMVNDPVTSMAVGHETWRGNIINIRASTCGGVVEIGDYCGGAMNGRNLSVGCGGSTVGVELRDQAGIGGVGFVFASLMSLGNPGIPVDPCANLLVFPSFLVGQGPVVPVSCIQSLVDSAFVGNQLLVPSSAAGATLHVQGVTILGPAVNSTNKVTIFLAP